MDQNRYFSFKRLQTAEELAESYRLRWQVYCLERGFLPAEDYPKKQETDRYDARSLHFGAFYCRTGELVGTLRLIVTDLEELPIFHHCQIDRGRLPSAVARQCGEISRLAVSKQLRRRKGDGHYGLAEAADAPREAASADRRVSPRRPQIVMGLYKALYQESLRHGVQYWFAAMETSLSRLLERFHFSFDVMGPEVDYYGPVTPYIAAIRNLERSVYRHHPEMLREFTDQLEPELLPPELRGPCEAVEST